ncbi:hypothetical protein HNY73_021176 [Argiope bruennichi]|uniref:Secreted protein n=1 Tax=Argiope bruennichi TaxID=94029 RepID=A0A8T0EDV7_ARGBR|nr:hypothetical protein HNY73_021176 [Argiope bruennichi]
MMLRASFLLRLFHFSCSTNDELRKRCSINSTKHICRFLAKMKEEPCREDSGVYTCSGLLFSLRMLARADGLILNSDLMYPILHVASTAFGDERICYKCIRISEEF